MVDVTELAEDGIEVRVGDEAVLMGRQGEESLTADELAAGFDADVAVLDPSSARRVPAAFVSRSSNSPFVGRKLTGWPVLTVLAGKTVFSSR